jgi:hypothetical protein
MNTQEVKFCLAIEWPSDKIKLVLIEGETQTVVQDMTVEFAKAITKWIPTGNARMINVDGKEYDIQVWETA